MLQTVILILLLAILLIAIAEIVARFGLGLGNPPLWQTDSKIEYLMQPSKSYRRFGKRISYNSHSMRSDELSKEKTNPDELRILVIGDSIINGGAHIDQDALATSILQTKLREVLDRPVVVCNIAAAGWGPPNYLEYIKRFGTFDADIALIVVNSEDYCDAPTFEPLSKKRPQQKPLFALQEIFSKYVPLIVQRLKRAGKITKPIREIPTSDQIKVCLDAVKEIVGLLRKDSVRVLFVQHLDKIELAGEPDIGHGKLGSVIQELDIDPVQLGGCFAKAIKDGIEPYYDRIHPSEAGQKVIGEVLLAMIISVVNLGKLQ